MTPATKPRNAEPIPSSVTPDAVAKKVITAASRAKVCATAVFKPQSPAFYNVAKVRW